MAARRKFTDAQLSQLLSHAAVEPVGFYTDYRGPVGNELPYGCLVDIALNDHPEDFVQRGFVWERREVPNFRRNDWRLQQASANHSNTYGEVHDPDTVLRVLEEAGMA